MSHPCQITVFSKPKDGTAQQGPARGHHDEVYPHCACRAAPVSAEGQAVGGFLAAQRNTPAAARSALHRCCRLPTGAPPWLLTPSYATCRYFESLMFLVEQAWWYYEVRPSPDAGSDQPGRAAAPSRQLDPFVLPFSPPPQKSPNPSNRPIRSTGQHPRVQEGAAVVQPAGLCRAGLQDVPRAEEAGGAFFWRAPMRLCAWRRLCVYELRVPAVCEILSPLQPAASP